VGSLSTFNGYRISEFIVLPFYLWAFYGCSVKRIWDKGFKSFTAISRGEVPKPFTLDQAMFWFECFLPFIGGLLFTLTIYGTIRDYHNFGTGKIAVIVDRRGYDTDFRIMSPNQWVENQGFDGYRARHGEHLTKYCPEHIAYDHLFLALYRHEIAEELVSIEWNRVWQQEYLPRTEMIAAYVRNSFRRIGRGPVSSGDFNSVAAPYRLPSR
jgi:hypothetical protein